MNCQELYSWDYYCHSLELHAVHHASSNTMCFFSSGLVHITFIAKPYFPFASLLIFCVVVSSIFPGFMACDCLHSSKYKMMYIDLYTELSDIAALLFIPPSTSGDICLAFWHLVLDERSKNQARQNWTQIPLNLSIPIKALTVYLGTDRWERILV